MHEVMGDPAGAGARRKFARRHLRDVETALLQQRLRHDDDLMPRQRRTDDRVRTGYIVGETIAGHQLEAPAVLLEIGSSVRLKQDLDVGMFAGFCTGYRVGDPMLAHLDLTELQLRNRRVVDPRFERRRFQRIYVKLAAKIGQCF
jgi:hypothetical protein